MTSANAPTDIYGGGAFSLGPWSPTESDGHGTWLSALRGLVMFMFIDNQVQMKYPPSFSIRATATPVPASQARMFPNACFRPRMVS